jgi:hypothetical protein
MSRSLNVDSAASNLQVHIVHGGKSHELFGQAFSFQNGIGHRSASLIQNVVKTMGHGITDLFAESYGL